MDWELVGILLKQYGIPYLIAGIFGWAFWQERKENRENAKAQAVADREDAKAMITVLVEVRDSLRSFKEIWDRAVPRR